MHDSVRRTQYLTEASVAASIAALLVLLKLLAPFLVFLTMMTSPIPIALICAFHGMRWGAGTAVATILLVNIIGGPEIGLTTAFYAAALGLAMGYGFRHEWSYGKTLHITVLAYLIEMSYKIVFSIYILGIADAFTSVVDRLVSFVRFLWVPLANTLGYDPAPERAIFTNTGLVMVGLLFIVNGYCYAYFNQEIGRELLKRLRAARRH